MSQSFTDVLANEPKIVKYLDIPIQHINDEILRRNEPPRQRTICTGSFQKLRHEILGPVLRRASSPACPVAEANLPSCAIS